MLNWCVWREVNACVHCGFVCHITNHNRPASADSLPLQDKLNTRPQSLTVEPPGFSNRGEVKYGSIGGLEYEVPQSRLYCLCINVALRSTALQCICRVIRRSSMTMKAHTYYIIFGRPTIGGSFPPPRGGATGLCRTLAWSRRAERSLLLLLVGAGAAQRAAAWAGTSAVRRQ